MEATTTRVNNALTTSGFIATEPTVNNFEKASVVRFALSINETNAKTKARTSALINVEKWVKNEDLDSVAALTKGQLVSVEGQLKPQQWLSADGTTKSRMYIGARVVTVLPYTKKEQA